MADDLRDIEAEIVAMQKAEDSLEYALAVQQIINAYRTVKTFITHLPQEFTLVITDGRLTDDLRLHEDGFTLGDMRIVFIARDESLTVTKNSTVLFEFSQNQAHGEKSFITELSKKIKNLVLQFQGQMKQKMAEAKERLMKKIADF